MQKTPVNGCFFTNLVRGVNRDPVLIDLEQI